MPLTKQQIHQAVKEDLLSFGSVFIKGVQFTSGHHDVIAQKLMAVEQGKTKRLIVNLPPRHAKSLLASVLFPAWFLGRNPKKRIIACSYGTALARNFGRQVRNLLDDSKYQQFFPTRLAQDSQAAENFSTVQGGGYFGAGVTAGITGRGAEILLIDDPIKSRQEADSQVYQDRLREWFAGTAYTRLEPNGAIILVMTRWSTNDLTQFLLDEYPDEGWDVLSLPAIGAAGQPLWAEQFSLKDLQDIKYAIGSREWNSQYQQLPTEDESIIFQTKWLKFYSEDPGAIFLGAKGHPKRLGVFPKPKVFHSWDLSFGGNKPDNSFCVGQCWVKSFGNLYLVDQIRAQLSFSGSLEAIRDLLLRYPSSTILIEKRANGAAVVESLQRELRGSGGCVVPIEPLGSKADRSYSCVPLFERGDVYLPEPQKHPWVRPLIRELQTFPLGSSDDCIDTMTQCLSWISFRPEGRIGTWSL